MSVITIRGQLGSGASEIGRSVARAIKGDYVEREIIAMVAERLKAAPEEIADKEMPPTGLWARILEALSRSGTYSGGAEVAWAPTWEIPLADAHYLDSLKFVITELTKHPPIVIRGRGSQFILKDHPGAFHVLLVAPLDVRLRHVMMVRGLSGEDATREIERFDSSRREFTKRYFQAELEDPVNYDIVINTEHLDYEAATRLIVEAAQLKS